MSASCLISNDESTVSIDIESDGLTYITDTIWDAKARFELSGFSKSDLLALAATITHHAESIK